MAVHANDSAATAEGQAQPMTGFVTSNDGTRIGYRQQGHGAGLVLVQGTMGTAQHFSELAGALAAHFTVYLPDRRGRGMSEAGGGSYSTQKEIEDLDALLSKTGAPFVFGLSSGAIITLQAALTLKSIQKFAIFEPPLFLNGAPTEAIKRVEREMAEGRLAAAAVTAMQAAQMGPPIFNRIPRGLLERMVKMGMAQEDRKGEGVYPTMRTLTRTT
ncbi:MAG: alpha/beta hydrolase, partial [Chloroflexota bacterium]